MATGDQAVMVNNEQVYITGRYKDLIIRGGQNVSPASIETVLDDVDGIVSQVVATPDDLAGEVPVAVISVANGKTADIPRLYERLRASLNKASVPEHIFTLQDLSLNEWPRTSGGKIRKIELREAVRIHLEKAEKLSATSAEQTTQASVMRIWSRLLKTPVDQLLLSSNIHEFADSITITRFRHLVAREFGKRVSAQDMFECPDIGQQVQLIEALAQQPTKGTSRPKREGPPDAKEIASYGLDSANFGRLKSSAQGLLERYSLSWDADLEDVFPVYDMGLLAFGHRHAQSQAWTLQFCFSTIKADALELHSAIELTLSRHPMFRSLMLVQDSAIATSHYLVIRPSKRWYSRVVKIMPELESADDIKYSYSSDPWLDLDQSPGCLFRVLICPIKNKGTAGLLFAASHSCFDAVSMQHFREDLDAALATKSSPGIPLSDYKLFADTFFLQKDSCSSQMSVDFHVRRLSGIGKLDKCLWPATNIASAQPDRSSPATGRRVVVRQVLVPQLQALKKRLLTSSPVILKAGLALANAQMTGQRDVFFAQFEAGRSWPFLAPEVAEYLPLLIGTHGPTFTSVINIMCINDHETTEQFFARMHAEQQVLTAHAHAPIFDIVDRLAPADGMQMLRIMRRQTFNWVPMAPLPEHLNLLGQQGFGEAGVIWNCTMPDSETVLVRAAYDSPGQLVEEIEDALERWMAALQWITQPANLSMRIGECRRTLDGAQT